MASKPPPPRVLMIAYHYPPFAGSSGVQRALKYSRYLPEHGWQPVVLSVSPRVYVETRRDQLAEIRPDIEVVRAWGFDAARELSIRGRYPGFLALPDRWASWAAFAIPAALWLARKHRVSAIWSTYPIATAHLIALAVARLTGLPWIADCRDSMTEADYPRDPAQRRVFLWLERRVVERAARVVMTTPGTVAMYRARYPEVPANRWVAIPNGYDEDDFGVLAPVPAAPAGAPMLLLHSGALYPIERDPSAFFGAIAELASAGRLGPGDLKVRLRATGHDREIAALVARFGVERFVELVPGIGHRDSIREMMQADGLLLLQAANCNHQIPAKLYEYLRSGRPVLGLTDPQGDSGRALRDAGLDRVVPLDDRAAIVAALEAMLARHRAGDGTGAALAVAERFSRRAQAGDLASLLGDVATSRNNGPKL